MQKYERGENRIAASTLFVAARILDVPVGFFFEGFDGADAERRNAAVDFWHSTEGRAIADAVTRVTDPDLRKHFLGLLQGLARRTVLDREG